MIGAGAIAGSLTGGYTNAARSPDARPADAADAVEAAPAAPVRAAASFPANPFASNAAAAQAAPPSPAAIVAMRFPSRTATARGEPAAHAAGAQNVMAFAAEPQRHAAARQAEPSGYQLASTDPAPPMPKRMVRPAQPKNPVLFNDAQLASIKARLRLTRDQEQYWPQVEQALRAISWRLASQQNARRPVRGHQAQMIDPNSPEVARLKSAAFPLIMSLREDQKQEVRQLAHTMGLSQVAAQF